MGCSPSIQWRQNQSTGCLLWLCSRDSLLACVGKQGAPWDCSLGTVLKPSLKEELTSWEFILVIVAQVPKAQTKQTQEDFCHWSLMSPTMQHFSSLPLELPMSFQSNLSLRSSTRHLYAFFKRKNLIKCSRVH